MYRPEQTAKALLHNSIQDFEDQVEAANSRENRDLLQVQSQTILYVHTNVALESWGVLSTITAICGELQGPR